MPSAIAAAATGLVERITSNPGWAKPPSIPLGSVPLGVGHFVSPEASFRAEVSTFVRNVINASSLTTAHSSKTRQETHGDGVLDNEDVS